MKKLLALLLLPVMLIAAQEAQDAVPEDAVEAQDVVKPQHSPEYMFAAYAVAIVKLAEAKQLKEKGLTMKADDTKAGAERLLLKAFPFKGFVSYGYDSYRQDDKPITTPLKITGRNLRLFIFRITILNA